MKDLLDQIKSALDAGHYYLCLYVALTLPDICGAIDAEDGKATGQTYAAWFDEFVGPKYTLPLPQELNFEVTSLWGYLMGKVRKH